MITYERPKWVLPGQQWSAGQTQLQYEQAGGKLAPGVSSVISAPITPYTPPAPIYAPTTPVVAPELAAFNQQMVNAPAPNVASPGYTGYGAAGAQGYYVKDSIAYDKATNRRIVELGKGWQFAEPAPTPANIQQAGSQVGQTYTVKSGDTLSKIAQRLGVSVGQISGYRSGNPNLIYPGENLTIGGTSATQGGTPSGQLTPEQTKYFQDQIAKIQTGITSIQNPIPVSGQGAAPTLPPQPSGAITQSYYSSAAQDLLKARTALEDAYTKQITDLQTKIDVSNKKIQDLNILQQEGIISNIETLSQPFREDLEKSERQRLYINQNFEDNQKLTNELDALLTEGNTIISEMKGVTGLAAIRNPRINDTITKISQRTGVIQAVMAARNNQINVAENMIDRSVNALAADKQDQINYYETLYNFYQSQKNKEGSKLITLTKDQKTYLNAQIGLLENDLKISQDSADYIKKLLTNPSNALLIAQAGVTLGDPPEVVNTKIATQIQRQEVIDFTNKKIEDGYIPIPFPQTGQQGLATFNVGGQNLTFKAPPVRGTTSGDLEKPMTLWEIGQFERLYGWTPPSGFTRSQLDQYVKDNPNATPEELEAGARQASGGATLTTDRNTIEGIRERIKKAKNSGYTEEEIKATIKSSYSKDELFAIAKGAGYAAWYTGKNTDIDRMLNALLSE